MDDYDDIPIRLPSGTKAIVKLPRPFTLDDAVHMMNFLEMYIEEKIKADSEGPRADNETKEKM